MDEGNQRTLEKTSSTSFRIRAALAVGVCVLVGGLVYSRLGSVARETTSPAAEEVIPVAFVPAATRGTGMYPNGTYTTTGEYAPHGVPTHIEVTIALENDAITTSDVVLLSEDRISQRVTGNFQTGYKPLVIGKSIQGLELDAVSGSSLTPIGYNAALRQIEEYAATL